MWVTCDVVFNPLSLCPPTSFFTTQKYIRFVWHNFVVMFTLTKTNVMLVYDVFFWVVIIMSYFLRDIPPFKQIWNIFKFILVVMLVVLGMNCAKKGVKEWWNS